MNRVRLVSSWNAARRTLGLLAGWSLLSVSTNLRFPGPEPVYWYFLPSLDVTALFLAFALLGLCGCRVPRQIHWVLTVVFIFLRLLRIGDGIKTRYFSTTFNLYIDSPLLPELVRLYYSTEPHWKFAFACLSIVSGIIALGWLTLWCFRQASSALLERKERSVFLGIVGTLAVTLPWGKRNDLHLGVFAKSAAPRLIQEVDYLIHGAQYRARMLDNIAQRGKLLRQRPNNLAKLQGANVYLFLIESYGQTVIERPIFSARASRMYERIESELRPIGFFIASAVLDSPTYGGSSWLAHATLGTGIRTDDQFRYRTICEAKPPTLALFFGKAGYRSVLAQPATTRPWPEGDFYGFTQKYYAWNFEYQGPSFSWAPMPDQYVVDLIRRTESTESRRQLFVQYALVSSHAPWNRQPPFIYDDSKLVGGKIYGSRRAITFPTDWSDMSRGADAYMHSVRYDFEVLRRYIANYIRDDALVIILGDHQPNGEITGHNGAHGVPIHVLSRKKAFVDAFLAHGYSDGMKPNLN